MAVYLSFYGSDNISQMMHWLQNKIVALKIANTYTYIHIKTCVPNIIHIYQNMIRQKALSSGTRGVLYTLTGIVGV